MSDDVPNGIADIVAPWGILPEPVFHLAKVFARKIDAADRSLQALPWEWDGSPTDVSPTLIGWLSGAQQSVDAASDLRALTTAYGHAVHRPRPTFARLAEAQKSSSAGLIKRYNRWHVNAIAQLLSPKPDINKIVYPFKSLAVEDLQGLSTAIDDELTKRSRRLLRTEQRHNSER